RRGGRGGHPCAAEPPVPLPVASLGGGGGASRPASRGQAGAGRVLPARRRGSPRGGSAVGAGGSAEPREARRARRDPGNGGGGPPPPPRPGGGRGRGPSAPLAPA